MKLHELKSAKGARKKAFRKGRGAGSGNGKEAGRGHGGLKSRSGHGGGTRPGFEGGQNPLITRLPKRGFVNIFKKQINEVNLSDLEERFNDGDIVTFETLKSAGLLKKELDGTKILGKGELKKKLTVQVSAFSASAKDKIEQAGGKAEVI